MNIHFFTIFILEQRLLSFIYLIHSKRNKGFVPLLEAVEKRFGGNAATKKTQRNLLKQQYENFTAPSSEMLDQTFDRLQKLFELWRMRIEQYIHMIDYALWEVIENGATLPKTQMVEGVMTVMPITSAEDKA
ncbi:hypothetical protein Tco_1228371 [Tanacetum coccineum]